MDTSDLDQAKYVSLISYKADGSAVSLPIWLAGRDGSYKMITEDGSWKVKRIRNNPNVQLQVCNMRGQVDEGATTFEGTAQIIEGAEVGAIEGEIWKKYGIVGKLLTLPEKLIAKIKRRPPAARVGIVVTTSG